MRVYPNGKDDKGTHVSLSLHLAQLDGEHKEPTPSRIYAEFTLRLIDRHHHKNWIVKGARWFSPRNPTDTLYEWPKLITKDYFKTKSAGFWSSCKDKCTIEAEVRVHGETTPLQS
nr:ubiquitin carboxyl-terminal hydrolase 12-like [Ipomoea batatas]